MTELLAIVEEDFCNGDGLDLHWQEIAKDLVNETPETREGAVLRFRERINEIQDSLSGLGDSWLIQNEQFLVRYLRGASWDVEEAVTLLTASHRQIQDYFPYMSAGPPSSLEHVWEKNLILIPAMRDRQGRRVVVLRLGKWHPQEVPLTDFFTAVFTMFEMLVDEEKTQVAGVSLVVDCKGFGLIHLKNFTLDIIICLNNFLNGAFPLWFRQIHLINNPMLFSVFGKLLNPFLTGRVRENIVYHNSDLTSLHREISPVLLPSCLGGNHVEQGGLASCVLAAKDKDSEFTEKIEQARKMLRN